MRALVGSALLLAATAAGAQEAGICPWAGEGGSLEVYAIDSAEGWTRVRCALAPAPGNATPDGLCIDWTACASPVSGGGLQYVAFVTRDGEKGGFIRWNPGTYAALAVVHAGSGGTTWFEDTRDVPAPDATDWQDLQDRGFRIVGLRWLDSGVAYASIGGRFVRATAAGSSLLETSRRANTVIEWIDTNLNPDGRPLALTGSSAGGDFVLSPLVVTSALVDRIPYIAYVSGAPFADFVNACAGTTPTGTLVDEDSGALGPAGIGNPPDFGNNPPTAAFPDGVWASPECSQRAVSAPTHDASSTLRLLDSALVARGSGYTGVFHNYIATGAANNDSLTGITWSAGQIHSHPYFAGATRIWDRCLDEGHGSQLRRPDLPCYDRIHEQLVAILAVAGPTLLRHDSIASLGPPRPDLAAVFPLNQARDGVGAIASGGFDPDATILDDAARPLVFYGVAGAAGPVNVVKSSGLVQLWF